MAKIHILMVKNSQRDLSGLYLAVSGIYINACNLPVKWNEVRKSMRELVYVFFSIFRYFWLI